MTERPLALVTGASRGLGKVLSEFLAGNGYDLLLLARARGPLVEHASNLGRYGGSVRTVVGDVSDPAVRQALVDVVEGVGSLTLLINNASELGPSPMPSLANVELGAVRRVFEVNVVAPLALIQVTRRYLAQARGLIVNITSDAAEGGYPGWGSYGASKAALNLLTRTLAGELEAEHVSVVAVDPGDMRTAMHQAAYPGQDISDRPPPETVLPFFAWLFGRERSAVSGHQYRAQSETWEVAPA